jgi:hypothetical protein
MTKSPNDQIVSTDQTTPWPNDSTAGPVTERRRQPRVSTVPPPPPPPPSLEDYEAIIGRSRLDELHFLARARRNKSVKMVNSTAMGGGVAEMLNRLIPLLNELEVATRWDVITGGNDFFEVTKGFHNALHGGEYHLSQEAMQIFLMYNEQNRQRMEFIEDLFVIHDPQPAGLIRARAEPGPLDLALSYRPVESAPRGMGISAALHRAVRRRHLFLPGVLPPARHSAISLLSLHRSAGGKEPGIGGKLRAEGVRRFRHGPCAAGGHADLAL